MRASRLIYIENDPALRNILGKMLASSPQLELLQDFGRAEDVLDRDLAKRADVALIDFALDHNGLNGVELGIALQSINEYMGIVIYSQFTVRQMVGRVPKEMRASWSFFEKSATMALDDYVSVLKVTAAGRGNWEDVLENDFDQQDSESSIFFTLTPRQRSIMTLTIQGKGAQEIAQNLDLSYSYVRKELSRAYAVLLPNSDSTTDLKTAAVIKYMELMRLL
jgi:DNA-binding NarL/FixJ family response regulator